MDYIAPNYTIISEKYLKRKQEEAVITFGTITVFTWRDLSHNSLSTDQDSKLKPPEDKEGVLSNKLRHSTEAGLAAYLGNLHTIQVHNIMVGL